MYWHDFILDLLIILIVILISSYTLTWIKTPNNLPPGPIGIPYLGYGPFLGKNPHLTLKKLAEKYGNILTLYINSERVVVLSSFKLIKELFLKQGHTYIERPDSYRMKFAFSKHRGFNASTAAPLTVLRRFTLSTFRDIGMGKTKMEPIMMEEICCLIEEIKKCKGQTAYFDDLLTKSVANVISTTLFGRRMEYTDEKFLHMLQLSKSFMLTLGINHSSQFLPQIITRLFWTNEPKVYGSQLYEEMLTQISNHYTNHKDLNIDCYVNDWKLESKKSDANSQFYTDERLAHVLLELFIAGNDTTSKTLELGILHLIKYPKIQEKIRHEIDNVIGKDRVPTMNDIKFMPFTEATLLEINRVAAILPLGLPRCSPVDNIVDGYLIPKNSVIIPNVWTVLNDPEVFPEPECFNPERFLTEDNKVIYKEELIPFSIGKRQCVGEALARMELFLYFTSLLQHFTFSKDDEVILKSQFSLIIEPIHQKIRAILR